MCDRGRLRQTDQGGGVVDALADRVDQIASHLHRG